ncbi:flagellar hook-length control protein FliK [Methylomonas sp. HW2-6]|uniref:flagellar hook-length control protein FliK n=1 Tax=Methylomonas sp. HW2-6 TaxID=3376687 RepID=UPI0040414E63
MNIQSSNPLSLLSGADPTAGLGAGMLGDGVNPGLFSATFLEQLAQLQTSLANSAGGSGGELANLQQFSGINAENLTGRDLQKVAAMFGNSVPTAAKLDQDIDLDDTMAALADVLQYLQSLDSVPATPPPTPAIAGAVQDDQNSEEADAVLAAAQAAAALAQIQANSASASDTSATQVSGASDLLSSADPVGQALAIVGNNSAETGVKTKLEAASVSAKSESPGQPADAGLAKALSGQDQADLRQDSPEDSANAFGNEADAIAAKNQTGSVDNGKHFAAMAADIAQLSKSVNSAGHSPATAEISKHLAQPGWNVELGEKLLWMHKQDIPSAEIRLNPEHMGPISIKIDVNQDQTSVSFTTQHAGVKEAIEAALPKLREMLGEQKLDLADVNVSQQHSEQKQGRESYQMAGDQRRSGNQDPDFTDGGANNTSATNILDEIEAGRAIASNGLLSLFA